jgi:cold shock CspA family protein
VLWFRGFLTRPGGPCPLRDVEGMAGFRSLEQGQGVRFQWLGREGPNGRRAAERIRLIDKGEGAPRGPVA